MDEENKNTNTTSEESVNHTEPEVKDVPKDETKTGSEVKEAPKAETKTAPESKKAEPKEDSQQEKPKKKKKVGLIVSIVIILLAVICGAIGGVVYALVFSKTEIDLSKYVTIEFEGYEGYASFDESDLVIDEKGLKKALDDNRLAKKLAEKIENKAEVKENEALENGDKIEVKVKLSNDWLKNNKIKLTSETFTITVKDLEEPNSIDLFEDLEFNYSGISPNLTVTVKNASTDSFIKNKVQFSMQKEDDTKSSYSLSNVANGDKITVSATYSQSDLEAQGYVVAKDEYTFTVENQAEYVNSADQITEEIKEKIEPKLLDKASNKAKSSDYDVTNIYKADFSEIEHYDYTLTHEEPTLEKMYLAVNTSDDIGYYDARNIVFAIYKVVYTDTTTSKTYDYYMIANVKDIVVDEDGLYTGRNYYYETNNYKWSDNDGTYKDSFDKTYQAIEQNYSDYTITEIK